MSTEEKTKSTEDEKINNDVKNNKKHFIQNNTELLKKVNGILKEFDKQEYIFEHRKWINKYAADVFTLILTANEMERRTLFYYITQKGDDIIQIPCDGIIYSFFSINGIKVAHVEPETIGSFTENGMAPTLKKALKRIKPTVVITLGVAFGVNYVEHEIGDVIIGRQYLEGNPEARVKINGVKKILFY